MSFRVRLMDAGVRNLLACIAQFLLCIAGGFLAGNLAEPGSGATSWTGAVGMLSALFLAHAAAQAVGYCSGRPSSASNCCAG